MNMKSLLAYFFVFSLFITRSSAQVGGSFVFDGINRSYIVYAPGSYVPGSSLPLVFVLHGFTQSAQNIMDVSGFNQVADTGNFIVVYPNGVGNAWNTNSGMTGGSTADDIGFISALTDTIFSQYGVDTTRVYSCGFSAGGYMSHRLACESPRCYAAIASVAGTMSTAAYSACIPSRPVPVLQIHGTADAVVSYNGGVGGVGVDDVITKWTTIDICPATPYVVQLPNTNIFDASTVESSLYGPCSSNTEVKLLKVVGGGHQWPGTTALLGGLGTINRDINASGEIWSFFRNKTCNTISTYVMEHETEKIIILPQGDGLVQLSTSSGQVLSYSLFDLNGRLLISGETSSGGLVDVSGISHGCYLMTTRTEHGFLSQRMIR
ncbi:MAG: PHB depolymerase family esterase [Bacteroidota bacterium]